MLRRLWESRLRGELGKRNSESVHAGGAPTFLGCLFVSQVLTLQECETFFVEGDVFGEDDRSGGYIEQAVLGVVVWVPYKHILEYFAILSVAVEDVFAQIVIMGSVNAG